MLSISLPVSGKLVILMGAAGLPIIRKLAETFQNKQSQLADDRQAGHIQLLMNFAKNGKLDFYKLTASLPFIGQLADKNESSLPMTGKLSSFTL
jgi:hypothetical protein